VERSSSFRFYAWHPLYSLSLPDGEKLKLLEQYPEFRPVVELYRVFGDSLNCVLCPYKSIGKLVVHNGVEDLSAVYYFAKEALTSRRWHRRFSRLANKTLLEALGGARSRAEPVENQGEQQEGPEGYQGHVDEPPQGVVPAEQGYRG
jgi:hypothetical protein